jgi:hypothetical protein
MVFLESSIGSENSKTTNSQGIKYKLTIMGQSLKEQKSNNQEPSSEL